ncbi:MAG: hypothetical protein ABR509_05450 [Candidatus Limnocylindria bacterium]
MVIKLECPWCSETLAISRDELDGEMRCDACGIGFSLVADAAAAADVVAVAA